MIKIASLIRLPHVTLRITREDVANHGIAAGRCATKVPGIILRRSQVDLGKATGALVAKKWIIEFAVTIFIAKEKSKRMLRIASCPAETTADANPGIRLETGR